MSRNRVEPVIIDKNIGLKLHVLEVPIGSRPTFLCLRMEKVTLYPFHVIVNLLSLRVFGKL